MSATGRPERIPTEYTVLDDRFWSCRGDKWLERHHSDCGWAEGPVWVPAGRYLLWSDIPGDRLLRFDETTGIVGVFREPSGHANGSTLDRSGRLVTCEHGNRRVTRTEHDGSVTVLADRFEGKRFNSPNDVVERSDGSIWFTDPDYGIRGWYEGTKSESEIGSRNVYRLDSGASTVTVVADDLDQPNGLAFSLDERTLYVVDSARQHIRAFALGEDGSLRGGKVLVTAAPGNGFDGLRLDDEGRIWAGAGSAVHCYHADGTLLGTLSVPEVVANLTFGGKRRNRLFITATTSLYSIRLAARGPSLLR